MKLDLIPLGLVPVQQKDLLVELVVEQQEDLQIEVLVERQEQQLVVALLLLGEVAPRVLTLRVFGQFLLTHNACFITKRSK
ncbi:hypothetical protein, partial [Dulcicalothrix desertica]